MRSDRSLRGLMMFADDVVICSWSTEPVDKAVFHIHGTRNTVVWMRGTRADGLC